MLYNPLLYPGWFMFICIAEPLFYWHPKCAKVLACLWFCLILGVTTQGPKPLVGGGEYAFCLVGSSTVLTCFGTHGSDWCDHGPGETEVLWPLWLLLAKLLWLYGQTRQPNTQKDWEKVFWKTPRILPVRHELWNAPSPIDHSQVF